MPKSSSWSEEFSQLGQLRESNPRHLRWLQHQLTNPTILPLSHWDGQKFGLGSNLMSCSLRIYLLVQARTMTSCNPHLHPNERNQWEREESDEWWQLTFPSSKYEINVSVMSGWHNSNISANIFSHHHSQVSPHTSQSGITRITRPRAWGKLDLQVLSWRNPSDYFIFLQNSYYSTQQKKFLMT